MSEQKGIADILKKIIATGAGAAFMSEEAIKSILTDLPLPKDIVNGLVQNAKSAKEEFIKGVHEEISKQLSRVDPSHIVNEVLSNYDIDVKAKISFKPKKEK